MAARKMSPREVPPRQKLAAMALGVIASGVEPRLVYGGATDPPRTESVTDTRTKRMPTTQRPSNPRRAERSQVDKDDRAKHRYSDRQHPLSWYTIGSSS